MSTIVYYFDVQCNAKHYNERLIVNESPECNCFFFSCHMVVNLIQRESVFMG